MESQKTPFNDVIDTPQKEREVASLLRREQQKQKAPRLSDAFAENLVTESSTEESDQQTAADRDESEQQYMHRLNAVRRVARVGELASAMYGQGGLSDAFGGVADVAGAGAEGGYGNVAGAARRVGSNYAGKKTSEFAKSKGVSTGRSAAMGGALSSALQGEGATGIAKGAANWYLLAIAFGALFTVVGSLPALLYLNFHFVMSKFGSKIFGELFVWQKVTLLFANMIAFFLTGLITFIFIVIADPCLLVDAIGTWWSKLFEVVCAVV